MRDFHIEDYYRPRDGDSTPSIRRAIEAAQTAGGGRVLASPGKVYVISPQTTYDALLPSGEIAQYPVCVQIPPGVTLDMRGSVLRLRGPAAAVLVANTNLSGTGTRDLNVGLSAAVLDGGNLPSRDTSLLHLAYVDRLVLRAVTIVRGNYVGAWIYNSHGSVFEQLAVDGFVGEPWLIGSAQGTTNQVYDSYFGTLRARNVAKFANPALVGNSFFLVLTRCHVALIEAAYCAAGIKVQGPSTDVTVGQVITSRCGDGGLNSGLKLQGDAAGRPVTRVTVGSVIAQGQSGPGLYMDGSVDCAVASYRGFGNNINGAKADVWIGGTNDHIRDLHSNESGGPGVLIRPYATGYSLDDVWVRNPNRSRDATGSAGVAIYGGTGAFGYVSCIDSRTLSRMEYGVNVNSPTAMGHVGVLEVKGERVLPFRSASTSFAAP